MLGCSPKGERGPLGGAWCSQRLPHARCLPAEPWICSTSVWPQTSNLQLFDSFSFSCSYCNLELTSIFHLRRLCSRSRASRLASLSSRSLQALDSQRASAAALWVHASYCDLKCETLGGRPRFHCFSKYDSLVPRPCALRPLLSNLTRRRSIPLGRLGARDHQNALHRPAPLAGRNFIVPC